VRRNHLALTATSSRATRSYNSARCPLRSKASQADTALQASEALPRNTYSPNQASNSQPNGLKMSRKPIRPIPTYQVATTAAIPEGMMAAYHNLQAGMLVGSIFELGWSSTTLQGPMASLVATGVSALQASCPVAPTHAGNHLAGGHGCRRPNRFRPTIPPVSRSSSLAAGSGATAHGPALAHVVSLHPPARACQSCLSGCQRSEAPSANLRLIPITSVGAAAFQPSLPVLPLGLSAERGAGDA
jgi:hypothetical protein